MDPYYQGEDIIFNIGGTGTVDLDVLEDFVLGIYTNTPATLCYHKPDLAPLAGGNLYQVIIPAATSRDMAPGWYTAEIRLVGGRKTGLQREKIFEVRRFRLKVD